VWPGVGIFFQQEPNTGKVYVANIVPGGSADRSGVIRVNDVIVKVDDEDVQGQPLSTLRNLILGRQGSYVVLAFRRMTGTELYYFDVELLRGSPEYFESLKKTQAMADEKEKLMTQVRQQEQEIQHLKQTNLRTSGGALAQPVPAPVPSVTLESLTRDLQTKVQEAKRLEELMKQTNEDSIIKKDAENALESLKNENRRYAIRSQARRIKHLAASVVRCSSSCLTKFASCSMEETLRTTRTGIADLQKRIEDDRAQQSHEKARMDKQVITADRAACMEASTFRSLNARLFTLHALNF